MFNILNHKGNENPIEIASHPSQNGYLQKNKQQQMPNGMQCGVGCEENTYTLLVGM
jgi:hypothetical protein